MIIYNKEPIQVMWDAVKNLSKDIKIYKESMYEDENSVPDSYLILESDLNDEVEYYADNKPFIRSSECNFLLITKGVAYNQNCLHNVNKRKITNALEKAGLDYIGRNLGYINELKSTQYSWSVTINYKLNKEK